MSVVQRCPSCGTTGVAPGECEACHEAELHYFCTNHEPGIWLDSATCRKCGARFGADAPATPRAGRSARRARARSSWPSAPTSAPPSAYSRTDPPRVVERSGRAAPMFDEPPLGRRLGGCLVRFVLFVLLLVLLLAGALFLFGRVL